MLKRNSNNYSKMFQLKHWHLFDRFYDGYSLDVVPQYRVPGELIPILKNNLKPHHNKEYIYKYWSNFIKELPHLDDIEEMDYFKTFKYLLYLEECYSNDSLDHLTKRKPVKVNRTISRYEFEIKLPNLDDDLCFLRSERTVELTNKVNKSVKFTLRVTKVESHSIIVKADPAFVIQYSNQDCYYIEFDYSNWPIRVCHYAIELVQEHDLLSSMLLNFKRTSNTSEAIITTWFNEKVEKNPEQMQAVKRIVGRTAYPSPYILFGPPGTGKTATIVEAVSQLSRLSKNILICTPSNAAADEITRRLLQNKVSEDLIYRMTSKSVDLKGVEETIFICMHFEKGEISYLPSWCIQQKQIVISTLVTCARLLRMSSLQNYFEYIFIDEAGQATQPETLIPIALLNAHSECQIVMSGDPKQLGPVVKTKHGHHLLGRSMIERLMQKSELYKKEGGNYDPDFITKLVQNYRSHSAILRLPNDMFYESELVACGGKEIHKAEKWSHLPNKQFPIIFHAVHGYEENNKLHSVANEEEAKIVIDYVEKLLDEDLDGLKVTESNIGIVTPFRYQKSIITKALATRGWNEISVGTVESFQGQERDIIIVSTVRSAVFQHDGKFHVGFLSDEKRFNVTITRAKCLLIVIGHPRVLQIDDCWRQFIAYCQENEACCGDIFTLKDISKSDLEKLLYNKIQLKEENKEGKPTWKNSLEAPGQFALEDFEDFPTLTPGSFSRGKIKKKCAQ